MELYSVGNAKAQSSQCVCCGGTIPLTTDILYQKAVADPGFLRGGRQHTILPNFPKTCIKLKEFGPEGRPSRLLLDPPLKSIS